MEVLRSALRRKETFWILGFTCSLSLFVEEKVSHADCPSCVCVADYIALFYRNVAQSSASPIVLEQYGSQS